MHGSGPLVACASLLEASTKARCPSNLAMVTRAPRCPLPARGCLCEWLAGASIGEPLNWQISCLTRFAGFCASHGFRHLQACLVCTTTTIIVIISSSSNSIASSSLGVGWALALRPAQAERGEHRYGVTFWPRCSTPTSASSRLHNCRAKAALALARSSSSETWRHRPTGLQKDRSHPFCQDLFGWRVCCVVVWHVRQWFASYIKLLIVLHAQDSNRC